MSLNKAMLIGNVGKDPEVRYLDGNSASGEKAKVAQFTLATTERYRDRSGEMRENTEWHNIVAWRGLADTVEKMVKKGSQLYIEGRIRTRSWDDKSGNKRYTTEIVADNIQLLGRRPDGQGAYAGQSYGPGQSAAAPQGGQSYGQSYGPQGGQVYGTPAQGQSYAAPVQPAQPSAPQGDFSAEPESDDLPF